MSVCCQADRCPCTRSTHKSRWTRSAGESQPKTQLERGRRPQSVELGRLVRATMGLLEEEGSKKGGGGRGRARDDESLGSLAQRVCGVGVLGGA